jgi:hypothetical protein
MNTVTVSRHAPAQTAAPPLRSGWHSSIRCGAVIRTCLPKSPFTSPLYYHAVEPAVAERRDDEAAPTEGSVRLGMALATQGDQAVAVEVRAALGALPHVMHLEAVRGEAASLARPLGTGHDPARISTSTTANREAGSSDALASAAKEHEHRDPAS